MRSAIPYHIQITPQYLLDTLPKRYRQVVRKIFSLVEGDHIDQAEQLIISQTEEMMYQLKNHRVSLRTVFQFFDTLNGYFYILRHDTQLSYSIAEILRLGSLLINCQAPDEDYARDIVRRICVNLKTWKRIHH